MVVRGQPNHFLVYLISSKVRCEFSTNKLANKGPQRSVLTDNDANRTKVNIKRTTNSRIFRSGWFALYERFTGMDTTCLYNQLLAGYLWGSPVSTDNYVPLFEPEPAHTATVFTAESKTQIKFMYTPHNISNWFRGVCPSQCFATASRHTCSGVPFQRRRRFVDEAPYGVELRGLRRFHCIRFFSRFPLLWIILQHCKQFLWTQTVIEVTRSWHVTAVALLTVIRENLPTLNNGVDVRLRIHCIRFKCLCFVNVSLCFGSFCSTVNCFYGHRRW